jgi:hypothetical protein
LQPLRFLGIIVGGVTFRGGRLLHVAGGAVINVAVEGIIRVVGDDWQIFGSGCSGVGSRKRQDTFNRKAVQHFRAKTVETTIPERVKRAGRVAAQAGRVADENVIVIAGDAVTGGEVA